jgi:hypothetical protein
MINFSKLMAWRASSVIALGITGLVFGLAGSRSHAQQCLVFEVGPFE